MGRPVRPRPLFALLALLGPGLGATHLTSCDGPDGREDVLTDSAYVEVMARLARVRSRYTPRDSVRSDSARRAVLAELNVEVSELAEYAGRYGGDPGHMMDIWTAVNQRVLALDSLDRAEELGAQDSASVDGERE